MPRLQCISQFQIILVAILHGLLILFMGHGILGDLGRCDISKDALLQLHITLRLDTIGRNAVAGDLCQQAAGHTFDGKGKGCVFNGAGVTDLGQHFQKTFGLFRGQAFHDGSCIRGGVTNLCSSGNGFFGIGGTGNQFHIQHFSFLL